MNATAARAAAAADLAPRNTDSRSAAVPSEARSLSPGGQQAQGAARRCACDGIVGAGGECAADQFIKRFQSGDLGPGVTPDRPWDEIFRPLRFAEVMISGTPAAPPFVPGTTGVPGSECDKLAAANAKKFGENIQLPRLKLCDPSTAPSR
jgi:hypothetical protein